MSKPGINIIGGKYRGKKLVGPKLDGLRPTANRIRETLFNWLQPYITDIHTLDLFSGSGLLSFEAISRGARSVTLIEKNKKVCQVLKQNATYFNQEIINVYHCDALKFIKQNDLTQFQLLFIDPPFAEALLQNLFTQLNAKLKKGTLLYIESPTPIDALPFDANCLKQKQSGQVCYALYQTC